MSVGMTHIKSLKRSRNKPKLSVLIPYFNDDPTALLHALLSQTAEQSGVEILIYDDGTADAALNARLSSAVKSAPCAVSLIIAEQNKGRSAARNHLKTKARADWVLFLDADMRPARAHFIDDDVALIEWPHRIYVCANPYWTPKISTPCFKAGDGRIANGPRGSASATRLNTRTFRPCIWVWKPQTHCYGASKIAVRIMCCSPANTQSWPKNSPSTAYHSACAASPVRRRCARSCGP